MHLQRTKEMRETVKTDEKGKRFNACKNKIPSQRTGRTGQIYDREWNQAKVKETGETSALFEDTVRNKDFAPNATRE